MIKSRTLKKTYYAFGFIGSMVLVLAVMAWVIVRPSIAPVATVEPSSAFDSIVVEQVEVIDHSDGGPVDVVARLKNPNARAGVADYRVVFVFLNEAGQEIERKAVNTYILPGSSQYVMVLGVQAGKIGIVRLDVPEAPEFTLLPLTLSLPSFNSFLRERYEKSIGTVRLEEQKGVVTNSGTFDWQKVEVKALALNRDGEAIGIGETFLGELRVGEQREFTVQWPFPTEVTDRVLVLPTTNIFKEENIVRVIGNPALLR